MDTLGQLYDRQPDASTIIGTGSMTLSKIVYQLLTCGYECEAGALRNNVAFQDLVARAYAEGCPYWGPKEPGITGSCGTCDHCRLFENV